MAGIYAGTITETALPEDLYFAIAEYLKQAIYEGFGGGLSDFRVDSVDYGMVSDLRDNIYMFSAAKTYNEVRDMSILAGSVPDYQTFRKEVMSIYEQYNLDWLKSEYNTAVASADMANKWLKIEKDADVLPMLRYDTTEVACPICAPLNGTVRPIGDAFWSTYYPPNHFNCMCVALQEPADTKITQIVPSTETEMQDIFKMNVGQSRIIFLPEHPYFTSVPKELGLNNFGLEIPEND